MKLNFVLIPVLLTTLYLQCASTSNILGGLTNLLSGTLNKVTKVADSITKPVLDTTTDVLGGGKGSLGGALSSVGSLVGDTLGGVGKVTGGLVQSVGDVAGGIVNAVGLLLEGVVGLTQELLDALKIYKKDDIPIHFKPLSERVFECFETVTKGFQILYPESVRLASNIYHSVSHYANVHNYCLTLSTEYEMTRCIEVIRISGAEELNRWNIDLVTIDVNKAAERGEYFKNQLIQCYTM